jgi:hypothetical protein
MDGGAGCTGNLTQAIDKPLPVVVILYDCHPFDPAHHHVVQRSRRIESCSSRHRVSCLVFSGFPFRLLSCLFDLVKYK